MKKIAPLVLFFASFSAFATEKCYQISQREHLWSKTPELLCLEKDKDGDQLYHFTLKTGMIEMRTVATFHLDLLLEGQNDLGNEQVYGVATPSNSTFNALSIVFRRTSEPGEKERGFVNIGETGFSYRAAF